MHSLLSMRFKISILVSIFMVFGTIWNVRRMSQYMIYIYTVHYIHTCINIYELEIMEIIGNIYTVFLFFIISNQERVNSKG